MGHAIREIIARQRDEFSLEYPCDSPIKKRWFVVRISRFDWHNDVRVIVSHQNVTELKEVQVQLADSKRRLQTVLDNVSNAIFTLRANGKIETINPAAANLFGYHHDELIGHNIRHLMGAPFNIKGVFKLLQGQIGHELIGVRRNQTTFPMYFAMNSINLNRKLIYTVVIQDLTHLRQMEQELMEKERMRIALDNERELRDIKNRFLSMMSHELKTPLASIRLSYDMLKNYDAQSSPEEKQQFLDNINIQVQHLAEMVDDVITLSKNDSTEQNFTSEQTDFITYCRDIIEPFQLTYYQTHQIEFECAESRLQLTIDKKILRRALNNLLSNAVKYSPEGGMVCIRMWTESDNILLSVSDSGIGIPKADLPRLFDPFHRATNVDSLPGSGLGLAIAKQAVELHDGTLTVETYPDSGTTFTICLPIKNS